MLMETPPHPEPRRRRESKDRARDPLDFDAPDPSTRPTEAGKENPRKADRRRPAEGPLVQSSPSDSSKQGLSVRPRSASRRLVLDVLLQRLVDLLHREQRRRPRAHQPRGRNGEREGAGADIVGEVEDDDGVVVAEREVHALELAAERLERVHDRCPSPRRLVLVQALEPLRGIGGLDHIFGHGSTPSLMGWRSQT